MKSKIYSKLLMLGMMCFLLMGASNCQVAQKYPAPKYEDCTVLTQWDASLSVDTASCFCIDDRLKKDGWDQFKTKVMSVYKEHPLAGYVSDYLDQHKDEIIKMKEYELPISYCRGFPTTNPTDKASLVKWAETNRVERIKCELNAN